MVDIQTGDILFFKGKTPIISPVIRWFTKSEFTHVGMAFSNNLVFEIDGNKDMAIRPIKRDVEIVVYRYKRKLTAKQKSMIKGKAITRAKHNKGYDWWRIIGFAIERFVKLPWSFDMKNREVCSEIVDYIYKDIGIDLVPDRADGDVRPSDLAKSSQIIEIGRLTAKPLKAQVV